MPLLCNSSATLSIPYPFAVAENDNSKSAIVFAKPCSLRTSLSIPMLLIIFARASFVGRFVGFLSGPNPHKSINGPIVTSRVLVELPIRIDSLITALKSSLIGITSLASKRLKVFISDSSI